MPRGRLENATRVLRACAFALAFALTGAVQGAQTASRFNVEVSVETHHPPVVTNSGQQPPVVTDSGFCRISNMPGAFGAMVTVVCATGVVVEIWSPASRPSWLPIHGGSYRFLPPVSLAGVMSGSLDMDTGLGTVTSWRVIKMADRDFLEMTVRW